MYSAQSASLSLSDPDAQLRQVAQKQRWTVATRDDVLRRCHTLLHHNHNNTDSTLRAKTPKSRPEPC